MLILTRKQGEAIKIGDDITITILGVNSGQVKVGVDAPRTVPVHREEIHKRIKRDRVDLKQMELNGYDKEF